MAEAITTENAGFPQRMRIGMSPEVRYKDHEDYWTVRWDCPDHPTCGYQRTFDSQAKANAFVARVKSQGCPNDPWFPDERSGE